MTPEQHAASDATKLKANAEIRKRAERMWGRIENDLADRGCFHGIDDETMGELREAQIVSLETDIRSAGNANA